MKAFFKYFPKVDYDIDGDGIFSRVTDITKRFKVRDLLKSKAALFANYYVHNGERPDIVSSKMYGRSDLDWLIFMCNDILDPFFHWPLSHWDLQDHIKSKYGSLQAANDEVHHYEKVIQAEGKMADGTRIPERFIYVDETTYDETAVAERRLVSALQWEQDENERKKNIRILDPRYLAQIMNEIEVIFGN